MLLVLADKLIRSGFVREANFIWKIAISEDDDDDWVDYDDLPDDEEETDDDDSNLPIMERAIKQFGLTYDYSVAGYICDDGTMLDFSGGASGGGRGLDHRAVENLVEGDFEYRSDAMRQFMKETGCIRLGVYGDTILLDAETVPTHEQLQTIRYILKDTGAVYANVSAPNKDRVVELDFPTPNQIYRILKGE